jgi:hypothetical protein
MNNSQLLISDLPFHTINANGRGDKWNRFMDVFIISILMLLSGYWLLYRRLIVPEMNSNQEKKADIVKTATESLKKTLRRRQSWILTLLASVCLSVASVPYVLSLIYHYQLDLSLHPIVKWPSVDVAIHSFFCAYLLMDLLVGYWHYREQLQLLSGWIHHLVYMALVISLVHHEITAPFPYFAIMELPTVVLAIGHVWRDWRSDKLFGLAFFVTRLVYHSALIYQFCFRFPLRGWWVVVVLAFVLHCHWFSCWVRRMRRLINCTFK